MWDLLTSVILTPSATSPVLFLFFYSCQLCYLMGSSFISCPSYECSSFLKNYFFIHLLSFHFNEFTFHFQKFKKFICSFSQFLLSWSFSSFKPLDIVLMVSFSLFWQFVLGVTKVPSVLSDMLTLTQCGFYYQHFLVGIP